MSNKPGFNPQQASGATGQPNPNQQSTTNRLSYQYSSQQQGQQQQQQQQNFHQNPHHYASNHRPHHSQNRPQGHPQHAHQQQQHLKNSQNQHQKSSNLVDVLDLNILETTEYPYCTDHSKYENLAKIGQGTFGEVYKARCRRSNDIVALKKVLTENEKEGVRNAATRSISGFISSCCIFSF